MVKDELKKQAEIYENDELNKQSEEKEITDDHIAFLGLVTMMNNEKRLTKEIATELKKLPHTMISQFYKILISDKGFCDS